MFRAASCLRRRRTLIVTIRVTTYKRLWLHVGMVITVTIKKWRDTLTPWSRVLLQKLPFPQLFKKFPALQETRSFTQPPRLMDQFCTLQLPSYGPVLHTEVSVLWTSSAHCSFSLMEQFCTLQFQSYGPVLHTAVSVLWTSSAHCSYRLMGQFCTLQLPSYGAVLHTTTKEFHNIYRHFKYKF